MQTPNRSDQLIPEGFGNQVFDEMIPRGSQFGKPNRIIGLMVGAEPEKCLRIR
jgi:hypothetical protein